MWNFAGTDDRLLTRRTIITAISFGALGAFSAFLIIFILYPTVTHADWILRNTAITTPEYELLKPPSWLLWFSHENQIAWTAALLSPLIPLAACFIFIIHACKGHVAGLIRRYPLRAPILILLGIASLFIALFACAHKAIIVFIGPAETEHAWGAISFIIFFLSFEGVLRTTQHKKPERTTKQTAAGLVVISLSFAVVLLIAIELKVHIMHEFFPILSDVAAPTYAELKTVSLFHMLSAAFMFSIIGSVLMLTANSTTLSELRRPLTVPAALLALYASYAAIFIATAHGTG